MATSALRTRDEDPRTSDYFDGIHYPSCDDQPMAENTAQWASILHTGNALRCWYMHDPNVMVVGNVFIYPERGNPQNNIVPDILVALGVPNLPPRTSYKVWVEGKPPDFVLEIAAPKAWQADRGWKKAAYAKMGVPEYWLFDPLGEFFDPRLEGYRLERGSYVPLAPLDHPELILWSNVLGLLLRPDDDHVRFDDPTTGERSYTLSELKALREELEAVREGEAAECRLEAAERREAEARAVELKALNRRLRSQSAA